MNVRKKLRCAGAVGLCAGAGWLMPALAQTDMPRLALAQTDMPRLALAQLTLPTNWQRAGSLTGSPEQSTLSTKPGDALLVGSAGQPLTLAQPTADFHLRLELLATAGADARLRLPGGSVVSLRNERLSKAPGLWQTVEVWYRTTDRNQPMLEKLLINNVVVDEGRLLPPATGGPVQLEVASGSVAVRNVAYRAFKDQVVARWTGPVRYQLYDGWTKDRAELANRKLLKDATTPALDLGVTYGQPRYVVLYTGTLSTDAQGDYLFELHAGGDVGLWIDGKEIVPVAYHDLNAVEHRRVTLTPGSHTVEVMLARSWARPGLGLFVSRADTRPQPLHVASSLPEAELPSPISAKVGAQPVLIRSFVQLPAEKTKRTHSLSVGTVPAMHYSVDLNQMALLQVWKGDFADVTEMWHERGEPQLLRPMGAVVYPAAQPTLAVLTGEQAAWPDSLDATQLQYKGLRIGPDGLPIMDYVLAGATISDHIRPAASALRRELTVSGAGNAPLYCRLAAGASIEAVGRGLYAIDDRSYYVRIDPKAKATVRQQGGKQELLLPVALKNGAGAVQYTLEF